MFLFGGSKKKNAKSRDAIVKSMREIKELENTPINVSINLEKYIELIKKHESSSKDVAKIDNEILACLQKVKSAILTNSLSNAEVLCSQMLERVNKRCSTNEKAPKIEFTPEEVYVQMLANLQDSRDKLATTLQNEQAKLKANPNNALARSNCDAYMAKLKTLNEKVDLYSNERSRETIMQSIKSLDNEYKQVLATRSVSNDEFEVAMNKLDDVRSKIIEDKNILNGAKDRFFNNSSASATNYGANTNAYGSSMSATEALYGSQGGVNNYGEQTQGNLSFDELCEEVETVLEGASQNEQKYATVIKNLNKTYSLKIEQLKQLLLERKTKSGAECVVIDGEIDKLKIDVDSCRKAIERYSNERAKNNEIMKIARRALTEKNIKEMNNSIMQGNSFMANLDQVALSINDVTNKANEQLDEIGTINMVADEAEIKTQSTTGKMFTDFSDINAKDEDKYADIEKMLDIRN